MILRNLAEEEWFVVGWVAINYILCQLIRKSWSVALSAAHQSVQGSMGVFSFPRQPYLSFPCGAAIVPAEAPVFLAGLFSLAPPARAGVRVCDSTRSVAEW